MPKEKDIETLIQRSSLGTRVAVAMRRQTPPGLVQRVLERSDALSNVRGDSTRIGHKPNSSGPAVSPRPTTVRAMPDDLTKRRPQDAGRIGTAEEWEVRYWCDALRCKREELFAAVGAVGNSVGAVKKQLGR